MLLQIIFSKGYLSFFFNLPAVAPDQDRLKNFSYSVILNII